jgi:hypothetical protein
MAHRNIGRRFILDAIVLALVTAEALERGVGWLVDRLRALRDREVAPEVAQRKNHRRPPRR